MKLPVTIILALMLLAGCATTQTATTADHLKYLPQDVQRVQLGMSLQAFQQAHAGEDLAIDNTMGFRISVTRAFPEGPVADIVYEFDAEGDNPLYELIIRYRDDVSADALAAEKYGPPNYEQTEWRFPTSDGFAIRVWTYQNKLIIVATIPGTEFAE
jgi:hypothetical protein